MSTSSIPTFKLALYNALVALQASTLAGVQVSYGAPFPNPQMEFVWIGDVTASEQDAVFLGRQKRDESYTLEATVWVAEQTTNQRAVTERAFVIAGTIETLLRADPTLTSTVREAGVTSMGLNEFPTEDGMGRSAMVEVMVSVVNRI